MIDKIPNIYYIPKQVQKGQWASVYNYRPKNENILAKKGEVFAVLNLKSDPGFDLITAGGIFLDFFHETYFEIQEESTLSALEKTVISSGKHLEKLINNDKSVSENGIQLEILALSIVDKYAYFVKAGDMTLQFLRDDNCVSLLPALKDPTGEKIVEVASMELLRGDRILLGTKALTDDYKKQDLEDVLSKFEITGLKIDEKKDSELAIMLVEFQTDDEDETEDMGLVAPAVAMGAVVAEEADLETSDSLDNSDTEVEPEAEDDEVEVINNSEELENEEDTVNESNEEISDDEFTVVEDLEKPENEDDEEMPDNEDKPKNEKNGKNGKNGKTYQVMLDSTKAKIKSFPRSIKGFVQEKKSGGNVKVGKTELPKNMIIIGVVIILLAGGLYFGVRKAITANQEKVEQEQAQVSLTELDNKVKEIESLVVEIQTTDSNEQRQEGLALVDEANALVAELQGVESVSSEVADYEARINSAEDFFNRTVAITTSAPLVDVASFFPDASISDIALSGETIYMTDSGLGKIYSVAKDGSGLTELVSDVEGASSISVDDRGNIIFLDNNEDNRIGVLDPKTKSIKRLAGTSVSTLSQVSALEFVNILDGRIYLIDQSGARVMYMQRSGDNYGLPVSRFELAELTTGKDLQVIDNKIYTIAQIKEGLYRYLDGQDDTPQFTGLEDGDNLLGASGFYVDGVNMYFSDPSKGRVMVFDKGVETARFKGQYIARTDGEIFNGLGDLVADNSNGSIFVISNNSLYKLDLNSVNEL